MLLYYNLCVCCPRFCFPYKSLMFMLNPGHYTPMYPWSPPNGRFFTPNIPSRFLPVSAVQSGRWGEGGLLCCVREVSGAKIGEGWIQIGQFALVCAMQSWRKIFIAPIPILSRTPSPVTGSARYLVLKLWVAPGSKTSWQKLRSVS